jgi:hypothetical protein
MTGAIFCYHSQNCGDGRGVASDHDALLENLEAIARFNLPILPLETIARALTDPATHALPEYFVGLSADDGTYLDWRDYQHPSLGLQKSFAGIIREHCDKHALPKVGMLTSFVIASPKARAAIDNECYEGLQLSTDDWWQEAAREGLIHIENHSWDHAHPAIGSAALDRGSLGSFHAVTSQELAAAQVIEAQSYIDDNCGQNNRRSCLFAYPYGHTNEYLVSHFLPNQGRRSGILGAFSTERAFVTKNTNPYCIPRYVCGEAWLGPEQFDAILSSLTAGTN